MPNPEKQGFNPEIQENETYTSRVLLHFTRHGEKENDPNKSGAEQSLTPVGKQQGLERGRKRGGAEPTAVAFGSPLPRAQEMAGFEMSGAEGTDDITGDESLAELKEKIDSGLVVGSRLAVDPRLGFHFEKNDYFKRVAQSIKENKVLSFQINESDQAAAEVGDTTSTTYSRAGAAVGKILRKYAEIAPRFDQIVDDPEAKKKYGAILERFNGSHGSVIDAFLAKVIEKTRGVEERDRFVAATGGQGFDFAEGFDVTLDTIDHSTEPKIQIRYRKDDKEGESLYEFDEEVPAEMIDEIIEEGEEKA